MKSRASLLQYHKQECEPYHEYSYIFDLPLIFPLCRVVFDQLERSIQLINRI